MSAKVTRCEDCGRVLSAIEAFAQKYMVCGKCARKKHREVAKR